MDVYILKFSVCLALFVLFYKLFLENQQMHRFKRFYLLASIAFAFSVPFITFTEYVEPVQPIESYQTSFEPIFVPQMVEEQQVNHLPIILWSIYGLGVLLFSAKFILNLIRIFNKIRKNETHKSQSFMYVLLNDLVIPHSFFSYIFLNKKTYKTEQIPNEVLIHEQTHAKQKHSIDVLLVELLQIVFWFHPLVYIIKHAIKLNHEFLADEAVINQGVEPSAYQQLLIAFSSNASKNQLASAINYSSIKKRFTVMKTHTSKRNIWLRSIVLLPLIAFSIYGFSERKEVFKFQENSLQDSIPVLILKQDPLTLTLNGKLTSLESLNEDFNDITNGKISDLRIEAEEMIKMSLLETISEKLKPNVSKILFKAESGIIEDRPFENTKKTSDLIDKPLLKLTDDVKLVCDNCTLDKGLLKNASVITSNNENIESFSVKIPSNPSVSIRGNKFNTEVLKQIESMNNDDQLMIFNIKTNTKNIDGYMLINVKTQQKATPEEIEEYNKLAKHCNVQLKTDNPIIKHNDKKRIEHLFGKMSEEQKKNAESYPDFSKLPPPPSPATGFIEVNGETLFMVHYNPKRYYNKKGYLVDKNGKTLNGNNQVNASDVLPGQYITKVYQNDKVVVEFKDNMPNQKNMKVIKGGDWKDVESHLKQDKKVINDVHIHIDKSENLFLNNKPVTLNTLAEKVNALNTHLSNDEKRKYLSANITYVDNTQIDLAKEITTVLLKNCNVYSSSSSNIETQKKFNLKNVNSNPYAGKSLEEAKEIYENETLDFSVKEQPKNSPWSISVGVNDVTFIETDEEPVTVKITEVELKEYNSMVKKFNALPKDKRIIKLKDFERISYIYSHLSEEQKKKAEPYPEFYKEL